MWLSLLVPHLLFLYSKYSLSVNRNDCPAGHITLQSPLQLCGVMRLSLSQGMCRSDAATSISESYEGELPALTLPSSPSLRLKRGASSRQTRTQEKNIPYLIYSIVSGCLSVTAT